MTDKFSAPQRAYKCFFFYAVSQANYTPFAEYLNDHGLGHEVVSSDDNKVNIVMHDEYQDFDREDCADVLGVAVDEIVPDSFIPSVE